jgi:hypothetical protein
MSLVNIQQPIYQTVNGLGMMVGTVRVANQSSWGGDRPEPDGACYTRCTGPARLNLWSNNRELYALTGSDLDPDFFIKGSKGKPGATAYVGIFTDSSRQRLCFKDPDDMQRFIDNWKSLKPTAKRKNGWWVLYCVDKDHPPLPKDYEPGDVPRPHEIWIGVEDPNGLPQALSDWK